MLDQIPNEVFIDFLLPHIDVKEVGSIAMLNHALNGLGNLQAVWKILYMRTTEPIILDTSVHLGFRRWLAVDPCDHFAQGYRPPWINPRGRPGQGVCSCIPTELILDLPRMISVFGDTVYGIDRGSKEWIALEVIYADIIREHWVKFNQERGISTTNLCQDIRHYDTKTLGIKEPGRNYKCYKRTTLKKLLTKAKKETKIKRKESDRALSRHNKAREREELARMELKRVKNDCDKIERLETNLKVATGAFWL